MARDKMRQLVKPSMILTFSLAKITKTAPKKAAAPKKVAPKKVAKKAAAKKAVAKKWAFRILNSFLLWF